MDGINIGLTTVRKLSAQQVISFLLALVFCTYLRISLLVIYPLLVVFLFYVYKWKVDRNAIYILLLSGAFWLLSLRNGVHLKYNILSLYFFIPFILLLFAAPSKLNSDRDFLKMLMYPLTLVAIVNNIFGFIQYAQQPGDDSFEGLYGTFTVSQNGLSLVNSVLFFYHLCMYQQRKKTIFLTLAIFFIISAVMGFYGAGLIAFIGAIILTFLTIRLKNIITVALSVGIILVLIYFLMKTISPLTLDYNVAIIKKFLDPTAANAPRKLTIFRNYVNAYTADVPDLLLGSGPGTFNSRSAFMVGSPTYFNADIIKSSEQPYYFREYAYTLWNPSNTGPYDGFMNQPFTSLLTLLGEYGLLITLAIIFVLFKRFRYFTGLGRSVARQNGLSAEFKIYRFCSVFALLLLIIDNYMEYPEIIALLLIAATLSRQRIRTVLNV